MQPQFYSKATGCPVSVCIVVSLNGSWMLCCGPQALFRAVWDALGPGVFPLRRVHTLLHGLPRGSFSLNVFHQRGASPSDSKLSQELEKIATEIRGVYVLARTGNETLDRVCFCCVVVESEVLNVFIPVVSISDHSFIPSASRSHKGGCAPRNQRGSFLLLFLLPHSGSEIKC